MRAEERAPKRVAIQRGDVLIVGRLLGLRPFLRKPIACTVSWRIQRSTRSPWNHVACYLGNGQIAEAEWNRGVRLADIRSEYLTGEYRIAIVRPPPGVDRESAVKRWREIASRSQGRRFYSLRMLLLMRVAAILFGSAGIRYVVRNNPNDEKWICSEVGAEGWHAHERFRLFRELLVTPDNFMDPAIGRELGIEQLEVPDPRTLELGA